MRIDKYSSLMRIEITTIGRPGRSHLQKESTEREKGQLRTVVDTTVVHGAITHQKIQFAHEN
jgi:hypothetical protein